MDRYRSRQPLNRNC